MPTYLIETDRLLLRPFQLSDVNDFAAICADADVMRYITGPQNKSKTAQNIKHWIANFERDSFGLLALLHREDQKLIGFCGLIPQQVDGEACIELGYRLAKDYWGKGLATEAAIAVRNDALDTHGIEHLISIIHQENDASKNVARKVGMKLLKKTTFKNTPVDIFNINLVA